MYVCVCKGVTDKCIQRAVDSGATRMRDLNQQLGVASQCGRCAQCARSVLESCKGPLQMMAQSPS
ncbi:MAG: (2Fe-2S)-binding protein [Gammaproteobacteria bacterium]